MRFVLVDTLKEGMILGKSLMGKNDELLLIKGTVLTGWYISKIKELGYSGIYINDDLSSDIQVTDIIDENLKYEAIRSIKEIFGKIESGKHIPFNLFRDISKTAMDIVDNILENKDVLVNIVDLKLFDDYTFYHSVDVCILSVVIGGELGLKRDTLHHLALSAILHDIGKTFIPKGILNKSEKLTSEEFELIKSHSVKGYNYIKENFDIPTISNTGILQHHEKFDGSGYPYKYFGEQISLFGRIISIADVYDALTSVRPYRNAIQPSEALEYIMGNGGVAFDPYLVKKFTKKVAPYPVGTSVLLSNGKIGLVVKNYPDCCTRPKLKIYRHGDEKVTPYYIDLKNDLNSIDVTIVGIL